MKKNNAFDWGKSPRLPLGEIEPENTHIHHIFPFDLMIKDKNAYKKFDGNNYSWSDYRSEINDIANMTFLSKLTNSAIGNASPSIYMLNETTPLIRKAHFIPEDKNLWKTENFYYFLEERRNLIATALTSFLKKL